MSFSMTTKADETLATRLNDLRGEHGDLDIAIRALEDGGSSHELQVKRLKKRKLQIKDEIVKIEDYLTPDIIA
jgi:hypothetical protein